MKSSASPAQARYSIPRRRLLQLALAGIATQLAPRFAAAQAWQDIPAIRELVGDAPRSERRLLISLPLVAEDGSAVPLTIQSDPGPGESRIHRLAIFAPGNPTPQVAEFEFGPDIPSVKIATRIRLSESQTVIAVAHTDDGQVLLAQREVRVTTSGCIAPGQSDGTNEMKARVRLPKVWQHGSTGEVLTMITHPMTTGLVSDADGATPPQRIIRTFKATLDDRPVLTATYYRSLSMNPYLRFDMMPGRAGEMRFIWTENTGRITEHTEALHLG